MIYSGDEQKAQQTAVLYWDVLRILKLQSCKNHERWSQQINDICPVYGRYWWQHMGQTYAIPDLTYCNPFLMQESDNDQTNVNQVQNLDFLTFLP